MTLRHLDISFNQLQELPSCLGALCSLTALLVQYNQISRIDPQVACLQALEVLQLNDNALVALPSELGRLCCLQHLAVQYNRLEGLPMQLSKLTALTCLELDGNPLKDAQLCSADTQPATQAVLQHLAHASARRGGADTPVDKAASVQPAHSRSRNMDRHVDVLNLDAGADGSAFSPSTSGAPLLSPVRNLHNSQADLELLDGPEGLHSHSDGSSLFPRAAHMPAANAQDGFSHATASSTLPLEELEGLPPAAAAALWRSYDMFQSGVQELREGRPLSRGGVAASQQPPPTASHARRPGTSLQRPGTSLLQRPTTASMQRPGTSSTQRPGTAAGRGPGAGGTSAAGGSSPGPPATGAMALLASAGISANGASQPSMAEAGVLASLPPITYPLPSGVRGLVRHASHTEQHQRTSAAASASASARPSSSGPTGGGPVEGSLDIVRSMLGGKNPQLLALLDQALRDDEGDEGQAGGQQQEPADG